jgi:hypothetical protein
MTNLEKRVLEAMLKYRGGFESHVWKATADYVPNLGKHVLKLYITPESPHFYWG